MFKYSIVVPVYNEAKTVGIVLENIYRSCIGKNCEVLVVDDASSDGSLEIVKSVLGKLFVDRSLIIQQQVNRGKGAAIREALFQCKGEFVVLQDADLEYDPADYQKMIKKVEIELALIVYGSRFVKGLSSTNIRRRNYFANRLLTLLSNYTAGLDLTDMETGMKVFKRTLIDPDALREPRFGIEPEITWLLSRSGHKFHEVGIDYSARSYSAGKKIGLLDGIRAVWVIVKLPVYNSFINWLFGNLGSKVSKD